DRIIGKHSKVAAPTGDHFVPAHNLIAVRIDEAVIVSHQFAECVWVAAVDAIDESQNGFSVSHFDLQSTSPWLVIGRQLYHKHTSAAATLETDSTSVNLGNPTRD